MPDEIWVRGGFKELIEARVFWQIGPQVSGMFIVGFALVAAAILLAPATPKPADKLVPAAAAASPNTAQAASSPAAPEAKSEESATTSDIPKTYPAAFAAFSNAIKPMGLSGDTFDKLRGVESPIRIVSLGGKPYIYGFVCAPHLCDEYAAIMFPQDQSTVFGQIGEAGDAVHEAKETPFGMPSEAEKACFARLMADENAKSCS